MDLETIIQNTARRGNQNSSGSSSWKGPRFQKGYTIDQIATAITTNVSTKKAGKTPFKEDFLKAVQDDAFIEEDGGQIS